MLPADNLEAETVPPLPGYRLRATSWVHYATSCNTQSSAPEDGRNNPPKHVELIAVINKPLLLHLFGCLRYLHQWCKVKQISNFRKYPRKALWSAEGPPFSWDMTPRRWIICSRRFERVVVPSVFQGFFFQDLQVVVPQDVGKSFPSGATSYPETKKPLSKFQINL